MSANWCGPAKYARADATAGTAELAPAIAGRRVIVLRYALGPGAGATECVFEDDTAEISRTILLAAGGGCGGTFTSAGHFQTGIGEALNFTTDATIGVDITYAYSTPGNE